MHKRDCPSDSRQIGRPRCERTHKAIISATEKLIGTLGFRDLSIEAIAREAGVSKASIYRRWPNKTAIVMDLLVNHLQPLICREPRATMLETLRDRVAGLVEVLEGPFARTIAGVIAAAQDDPEMRQAFSQEFVKDRRAESRRILERACEAGEMAPDTDTDLLIDILYGPIFYRCLISREPVDPAYLDKLVAAVAKLSGHPTDV